MRLIATGAAPLKPDILQFFRAALGAVVFEVRNASVYLSFSILPDQRPLLRVCCFPFEVSYKFQVPLHLYYSTSPQGYGQTECCGACSLTLSEDHSVGHVGGVLPSNQIKLESVPDMGYLAEENKGEICLKGPNVFQG